jgi:TolB-like protein
VERACEKRVTLARTIVTLGAMHRLKLFGNFELAGPEGRVAFPSAKLSACLAYLALAPRAVPREELTALLWGRHFDEQARQNFRQALARLRKAVGADAIETDDATIRLVAGAFESDVEEFLALIRSGSVGDLRKAVVLAGGDLLASIGVREAGWDEWLSSERRRIGAMICDALVKLAELELKAGDSSSALSHAEEGIRRDIFREDAYRVAIAALTALGRRSDAIRLYQNLAERLKNELGTEPEHETVAAVKQVKTPAAQARVALPPSTEARKPSLAVLPFANLSADTEQDYFIDGVVDEIITSLSRFNWLFVIARNSSFTYKGRAVDVKQVGRELGVRYVLEGSVRKAGNRIRIAGQLVDATTGGNLWSDRIEGELSNVFELQDIVAAQVVGAIAPRLEQAEIERTRRKPTASLDAFDHYLRGQAEVAKWTRDGNREAFEHFSRAIALDPEFAGAYAMAARCYSQGKAMGWSAGIAHDHAEVKRLTRRAIDLGRDDPVVLSASGLAVGYVLGDLDQGVALLEETIHISPHFAQGWFFCGWVQGWRGEADAAIARISRALLLSPRDPHISNMRRGIAFAYFVAGRYAEAIAAAEVVTPVPQNAVFGYATIAASAAFEGRHAEAGRAMATLLAYDPGLQVNGLRDRFPMRRDDDFARWAEGLKRAGLPD